MSDTITVTARIPARDNERLQALAQTTGRTKGSLVQRHTNRCPVVTPAGFRRGSRGVSEPGFPPETCGNECASEQVCLGGESPLREMSTPGS